MGILHHFHGECGGGGEEGGGEPSDVGEVRGRVYFHSDHSELCVWWVSSNKN